MKYLLLVMVLLVSGCASTNPTNKEIFIKGWYSGYEYGMARKSCKVYKMTEGVAINEY